MAPYWLLENGQFCYINSTVKEFRGGAPWVGQGGVNFKKQVNLSSVGVVAVAVAWPASCPALAPVALRGAAPRRPGPVHPLRGRPGEVRGLELPSRALPPGVLMPDGSVKAALADCEGV